MAHQSTESFGRCDAEEFIDVGGRDLSVSDGQELFEQRLAVAHRTGGPAGEDLQCFGVDRHAFGRRDLGQPLLNRGRADTGEIEPLAAGQDGDRNLLGLGRGENELHMFGRFFERFQEGVEGAWRKHVYFVNYVYLEAGSRRANCCVLPQLSYLIYAVIARAVDFQNINVVPS